MKRELITNISKIKDYVNEMLGLLHKKRRDAITSAVIGIILSASLRVSQMGIGLAEAKGLVPKHAVKQLDRLLSNEGIRVEELSEITATELIGNRKQIMAAIDWTSFEKDDHITLTINLITNHGRATPMLWKTIPKSQLKGKQTAIEDELLAKLRKVVSRDVECTIVGDRGFGSIHRFKYIKKKLGFEYIIRFKGNIYVSYKGITKTASQWLKQGHGSRTMKEATVTKENFEVGKVIVVRDKDMKGIWCLACSKSDLPTKLAKYYYGKRWGIETSYKDKKDIYLGMGLSKTHVKRIDRRDRLFLLSTLAIIFLTLLGAASERVGFDRCIKANTVKRRTHSLFRQGYIIFKLLPKMLEKYFVPLIEVFDELLKKRKSFSEMFCYV